MYCDVNNRSEIMEEIVTKEKACKSAESASSNVIATDLDVKLVAELEQSSAHTKNASRGFVDKVMFAEFQADAQIMGRSIDGELLLLLSSDADIPLIAGDDCLALKECHCSHGHHGWDNI